jgi:hypothetical protein
VRGRLVALAAVAGLLLARPAPAERVVAGVAFPARIEAGEVALDLCSAALLRWKRIVRAYAGGLYLDDCAALHAPLADVPKRLELSYLRGFRRGQFAEAADAILSRTFAAQQLAPLRPRIERLHAAYRDVGPGDRYALTYRPGVGTELALNGEPLVVVPGADFAAAYFAIWLGPEPADQRFRDDLLRRP